MTTMMTQAVRLIKVMEGMEACNHPTVIAPEIMANTEAILFFKKLSKGKQHQRNSQGVWMQRDRSCASGWSQPAAIHMEKGDVYWAPCDRVTKADVVILIQDARLVQRFQMFGQVGLGCEKENRLGRGICFGNKEENLSFFANALEAQPEMLQQEAFTFSIFEGNFLPVDIESPLIKFRPSSTRKFYGEARIDLDKLLTKGSAILEFTRSELVHTMQVICYRFFDLERRFPGYVVKATKTASEAWSEDTNEGSIECPSSIDVDSSLTSHATLDSASSEQESKWIWLDESPGSQRSELSTGGTRERTNSFDFDTV